MADDRKDATAFAVIFPANTGFRQTIRESWELEAGRTLRAVPVLVNDGDCARRTAVALCARAGIFSVVDGASRLRRDSKKMVWNARAVNRRKVVIGKGETPRVSPKVGNLCFARLRVSTPTAANQIKLVHFALVYGQHGTVPAIAKAALLIDVGHKAETNPLAARKQTRTCAVCTGKCTEIIVERVILVDDKNGMLNAAQAFGNERTAGRRTSSEERRNRSEHDKN